MISERAASIIRQTSSESLVDGLEVIIRRKKGLQMDKPGERRLLAIGNEYGDDPDMLGRAMGLMIAYIQGLVEHGIDIQNYSMNEKSTLLNGLMRRLEALSTDKSRQYTFPEIEAEDPHLAHSMMRITRALGEYTPVMDKGFKRAAVYRGVMQYYRALQEPEVVELAN